MTQGTKVATRKPEVEPVDSEVVQFRSACESRSVLAEIIRAGAQRMLQSAIEAEVDQFLATHANRCDEADRRQVVRNGHLPSRELVTGAGRIEVTQPRVRDRSSHQEGRVQFSSSILPPYLRRTKSIGELIPWLYLKGISTGDFDEALRSLLGVDCPGLVNVRRIAWPSWPVAAGSPWAL